MNLLKSLALGVVLLAVSCGGDAHHESDAKPAHPGAGDQAESHAASPLEHLALNDGKRWEMDEHTRTLFARMAETAGSSEVTSVVSRRALGVTLKTQLDELIRGCTMQGPAHDQLHVFLVEYIPAVNGLADAGPAGESEAALDRVRALLDGYPAYFK